MHTFRRRFLQFLSWLGCERQVFGGLLAFAIGTLLFFGWTGVSILLCCALLLMNGIGRASMFSAQYTTGYGELLRTAPNDGRRPPPLYSPFLDWRDALLLVFIWAWFRWTLEHLAGLRTLDFRPTPRLVYYLFTHLDLAPLHLWCGISSLTTVFLAIRLGDRRSLSALAWFVPLLIQLRHYPSAFLPLLFVFVVLQQVLLRRAYRIAMTNPPPAPPLSLRLGGTWRQLAPRSPIPPYRFATGLRSLLLAAWYTYALMPSYTWPGLKQSPALLGLALAQGIIFWAFIIFLMNLPSAPAYLPHLIGWRYVRRLARLMLGPLFALVLAGLFVLAVPLFGIFPRPVAALMALCVLVFGKLIVDWTRLERRWNIAGEQRLGSDMSEPTINSEFIQLLRRGEFIKALVKLSERTQRRQARTGASLGDLPIIRHFRHRLFDRHLWRETLIIGACLMLGSWLVNKTQILGFILVSSSALAAMFYLIWKSVIRVTQFHPLLSPAYTTLLKASPWHSGRPLPLGSVTLRLRDLLWLAIFSAIACGFAINVVLPDVIALGLRGRALWTYIAAATMLPWGAFFFFRVMASLQILYYLGMYGHLSWMIACAALAGCSGTVSPWCALAILPLLIINEFALAHSIRLFPYDNLEVDLRPPRLRGMQLTGRVRLGDFLFYKEGELMAQSGNFAFMAPLRVTPRFPASWVIRSVLLLAWFAALFELGSGGQAMGIPELVAAGIIYGVFMLYVNGLLIFAQHPTSWWTQIRLGKWILWSHDRRAIYFLAAAACIFGAAALILILSEHATITWAWRIAIPLLLLWPIALYRFAPDVNRFFLTGAHRIRLFPRGPRRRSNGA